LHRFSRTIVDTYQTIYVGDVSSLKLAKTRMAKSVLDAGWGILKTQLQYKGQQAGRSVLIVNERDTTRTCSSCKALTGPTGLDMVVVRTWVCSACGGTHDRDVNAARNILSAGRRPPPRLRERVTAFNRAAEPDIPSMQGRGQRGERGGVSTGGSGMRCPGRLTRCIRNTRIEAARRLDVTHRLGVAYFRGEVAEQC
jgi:IS605 OrfB family transposase